MTKNVTTYVIAAIAILLLSACASPKNVAYIQNSEAFVADSSAFLYEAHIMPKDVLTITVNTINPEISAPLQSDGICNVGNLIDWQPDGELQPCFANLPGEQRWHYIFSCAGYTESRRIVEG